MDKQLAEATPREQQQQQQQQHQQQQQLAVDSKPPTTPTSGRSSSNISTGSLKGGSFPPQALHLSNPPSLAVDQVDRFDQVNAEYEHWSSVVDQLVGQLQQREAEVGEQLEELAARRATVAGLLHSTPAPLGYSSTRSIATLVNVR
jgi:hypothetical protein